MVVRALQVTNLDLNTDLTVTLYDGNSTANPLVIAGCSRNSSQQFNYSPGIGTQGNNIYFALSKAASGTVYVSAQGLMLMSAGEIV